MNTARRRDDGDDGDEVVGGELKGGGMGMGIGIGMGMGWD